MQATFASSTARSRPFLVGLAVFIVCILSIFGIASQSSRIDSLPIPNDTQSQRTAGVIATETTPKKHKDVLLYAYYETDDARGNLEFFIRHGLHAKMDFVIIVNGEDLSVEIPVADNIKVVRRPNTCFDLGSFGEVLNANNGAIKKKYDRFILLNSSVRGPFLPNWTRLTRTCWSDIFLNSLTDETKMLGLTANCAPGFRKHIQSMLLSVDRVGLDIIMPGLQCSSTLWEAVANGETAITGMVREAGFVAEPIYSLRHKRRYETSEDFWDHCDNIDIFFPEQYDSMDMHPFDSIFVKTDRKFGRNTYAPAGQLVVERLTEWTDNSKYSSYDYC